MKSEMTLSDMAAELERQRATKRDYLVDTRRVRFGVGPQGDVRLGADLPGDGATEMPVRRTAHRQFAGTLGVPQPYYDRCLEKAPELLATNLNHWLDDLGSTRLLRTLDGQVRAFLSDRYRPLDNYDLAEAVLPKLAELEAEVKSVAITEDRFYLKAVTPRVRGEVKQGDVVQAGLVVSNSEVGAGSLRIEELDYRLVCRNGMIRAKAVRKTHLGRGNTVDLLEGAQEFLRDETRQLQDRTFWHEVQDVTAGMFNQERFSKRLLQYQEAATVQVEDPVRATELVGNRFDLGQEERASVLKHLTRGGDLSAWGVANAVTRASQDVEDYGRATELEAVGGKVIELKPTEWR